MKEKYLYVLIGVLALGFVYQTFMVLNTKDRLEENHQAIEAKNVMNIEQLSNITKICAAISSTAQNATDIIHKTINFVYDHSIHAIDEEQNTYLTKMTTEKFLEVGIQGLLVSYNNPNAKKIHLSCGLRSNLVKHILSNMKINSRIVQIFSDKNQTFSRHRLLEVYNPDTKRWELWDPDHRVTYIDRKSNQRIDAMQFVFSEKDGIIPVNGNIMGWKENHVTDLLLGFEGAIMFEQRSPFTPGNIILVNSNLFDLHKRTYNGRSFMDLLSQEYRYARLIMVN